MGLEGFDIKLGKKEDNDLLRALSNHAPGLKEISIYQPEWNLRDPVEGELEDAEICQQFDAALEQFLQAYQQSLQSIEILDACSLGNLRHPPLVSVFKLTMTTWSEEQLEEFWEAIRYIDYDRSMPELKEVEISVRVRDPDNVDDDSDNHDFNAEWPATVQEGEMLYCSTSVEKMDLKMEYVEIMLRPMQKLFPNVTVLHLFLYHCGRGDMDALPLTEICGCWPQLVELKIKGHGNTLSWNYDAEFIGVHEEEAKLLRKRTTDNDYLRQVHIVPIKPCLLTMSSKYSNFSARLRV